MLNVSVAFKVYLVDGQNGANGPDVDPVVVKTSGGLPTEPAINPDLVIH